MKNKLFQITIFLLVAVSLSTSTSVLAAESSKTSEKGVRAEFYELDGCISRRIMLTAFHLTNNFGEEYGYPEDYASAYFSVEYFDTCQNELLVTMRGSSMIDPSDIEISNNLARARLRTTIKVYDYLNNNEFYDINVDVIWAAIEPPFRARGIYSERWPNCHYVDQYKSIERAGTAKGSISGDSVDFPEIEFNFASLDSYKDHVITNYGDCGG